MTYVYIGQPRVAPHGRATLNNLPSLEFLHSWVTFQPTLMRWRPMPPTRRGSAGHTWTRLGTFGRDCSVYIKEGPRACGPGAQVRLCALRAEPAEHRVSGVRKGTRGGSHTGGQDRRRTGAQKGSQLGNIGGSGINPG